MFSTRVVSASTRTYKAYTTGGQWHQSGIAVAQMVANGEVIADYPDDQPFPSVLLLGYYGNQPVHAVVAHESITGACHLVTVYWPDPAIWDESFKRRRA